LYPENLDGRMRICYPMCNSSGKCLGCCNVLQLFLSIGGLLTISTAKWQPDGGNCQLTALKQGTFGLYANRVVKSGIL
jgi:hypothetical protein